jgi:hypothetical protein
MAATVLPSVSEALTSLKQRRAFQWILLRIDPDSLQVAVERTGSGDAALLAALPRNDARFLIYDRESQRQAGPSSTRGIAFVTWTPDGAHARAKALYSSQRRALDGAVTGVHDAHAASAAQLWRALGRQPDVAAANEEEEAQAAWDPDA